MQVVAEGLGLGLLRDRLLEVDQVDGLVLARSAFHHSIYINLQYIMKFLFITELSANKIIISALKNGIQYPRRQGSRLVFHLTMTVNFGKAK